MLMSDPDRTEELMQEKEQKNKPTKKTFLDGRKRILTGMQPTGEPHLGNYFGGIRPAIDMSHSKENEVILLCVDWHGLTNRAKILTPGELSYKIIATYLALGFNTEDNSIVLQSDFPQIQQNAWYLSCATGVGLLERAHAYKDALANGKEATAGLLYYTVLMSSDIVSFDAQIIPVGKDQSQHLEYASDMARMFNNLVHTDVFVEPKAMIQEVPLLPGLDGRKMSKSYNNTIPLFAPRKDVEKRVKEIKTDSLGLNDPKDPKNCLIFNLFESFASSDAIAHMKERLEKGVGYGYGHAKSDFIDEYERVFSEKRKIYEYYVANTNELKPLLEAGYSRAYSYAQTVTQRARDALGLQSLI